MKKYLLGSLVIGLLATNMGLETAKAATAVGTSEGDVTFTPGDIQGIDDPIVPGNEIIPEDPKDIIEPIIAGNIGITHVPFFHFGSVGISPKETNYPVEKTGFTTIPDNPEEKPTTFYASSFLQVHDAAGKDNSTWSVTVTQNAPLSYTDKETDKTSTLTNTRIHLKGQTVTNTNNQNTTPQDNLGTFDVTNDYSAIPTKAEGDLAVFNSMKTPGYTNNSKSSLVFEDNYTVAEKATAEEIANKEKDRTSDGVLLNVPNGEKPLTDAKYSATLTWALTAAP